MKISALTELAICLVIAGSFCELSRCEVPQEKDMKNDILSKEVTSFILVTASLRDTVKSLRQNGLRVCFEEAKDGDREKNISVEFHKLSVKCLLDELSGRFPDYNWKKEQGGGSLIVIQPKSGSILKWNMPSLRVKNRTLMDILVKEDMLDLKKHGIVVFYRGFAQPLNTLINVELSDQPASVCLNALVSQCPKLCWTIFTNPQGKNILTLHFAKDENEQSLPDGEKVK